MAERDYSALVERALRFMRTAVAPVEASPLDLVNRAARATTGDLFFPIERRHKVRVRDWEDEVLRRDQMERALRPLGP